MRKNALKACSLFTTTLQSATGLDLFAEKDWIHNERRSPWSNAKYILFQGMKPTTVATQKYPQNQNTRAIHLEAFVENFLMVELVA
jgi:hypothetical protein